jgi:hypothetical protein
MGGPNQVVRASRRPWSVPSPTHATCPSGRINTAVGAATAPSTGSSHTPAYRASTRSTRPAHGAMSRAPGSPRLSSTGRASCSRVNTRRGPLAVTKLLVPLRSWSALVARGGAALVVAAVVMSTDAALATPAETEATCLASGGKTACGYHCLASFGEVRCAQRPDGMCIAGVGTVACWDAPPLLRAIFVDRLPRPQCVASAGQVACGYQCVINYDRVLCAETPFGACKANEGRLVCWDPPGPIIASLGDRTPRATCVSNYGKVACGYDCIANFGMVRCAKTPRDFVSPNEISFSAGIRRSPPGDSRSIQLPRWRAWARRADCLVGTRVSPPPASRVAPRRAIKCAARSTAR